MVAQDRREGTGTQRGVRGSLPAFPVEEALPVVRQVPHVHPEDGVGIAAGGFGRYALPCVVGRVALGVGENQRLAGAAAVRSKGKGNGLRFRGRHAAPVFLPCRQARQGCAVDENGLLTDVTERTHIIDAVDGQLYTEDGATYHKLPDDTRVSMNMWGFTEGFMEELGRGFPAFLDRALKENPIKAEYFVPSVVSGMIHAGKATVRVLPTSDKWHGVTYREDRASVVDAIAGMTAEGLYPSPLWA